MLAMFERMSWGQRISVGATLTGAAVLVVLEGLTAPTPPTAIGLVVCGLVALAALFVPSSPGVVAGVAFLSIGFTIACRLLPDRPENTFGVVELIALALLAVRVIIQLRPLQSLLLVPLIGVAGIALPFRLTDQGSYILGLMEAVLVLGMGLIVLIGMYLRLQDRQKVNAYELARQSQRLAYARDLHDFVAHHITAIVAQAKAVRFTTAAGMQPAPDALDEMLAGIEKAGSQALVSMRGMITVLRGDEKTPMRKTLGEVVSEAVDHFVGPPAVTHLDDGLAETYLAPHTLDAAQHVVQESLTNVLRHAAEVTHVEISARRQPDEQLEIVVRNNGRSQPDPVSSGFGLMGLGERVEAAGGRLTAGPVHGGWQVAAVLPLTLALPSSTA